MVRHFRRKLGTQEHIDRHHHVGGIFHLSKGLADFRLRIGSQVFLPAVHALLFACHRKHQCCRMIPVDIDSICHLHGKEASQAHAVTLSNRLAKNKFSLFDTAFAAKFHFCTGGMQNGLGNAHRVIPVKAHFFLDLVQAFDAFRNLERNSLFLEFRKRFKAFGASGERQVFGTGLFSLQFHLGQIFAGNAHIFEKAGTFRHQGVDLFLTFVVLFIKEFAFLVRRFAVLPAGSNSHIALLAGFFQISLCAVQCGTLLDGVHIGTLLRKRNRGENRNSRN